MQSIRLIQLQQVHHLVYLTLNLNKKEEEIIRLPATLLSLV